MPNLPLGERVLFPRWSHSLTGGRFPKLACLSFGTHWVIATKAPGTMNKRNPNDGSSPTAQPDPMIPATGEDSCWLTSDSARKALHVGTCELMHLRVGGQLRFRKRGNAYLYHPADIVAHRQRLAR